MAFEIRVGGQKFTLWERARLERSIDANAGIFEFSSSNTLPANFPVRAGDAVEIVINGETKLKGFADTVRSEISGSGQTVTVAGRDNTADLIDSAVPDSAKNIPSPITLTDFCERVIAALGADIAVENVLGQSVSVSAPPPDDEFDEDTGITADSGQLCMDFLTSFARKKQVYLVASGDGRLLIYRPGSERAGTPILNRVNSADNNVKSSSAAFDHQNRFGRYRITSQANVGFEDSYDDEVADHKGNATDAEIRSSRYYEAQAEESMSSAECEKRAIEEANIRKGRSTDYEATLAGLTQNDGTLWDFGQLVKVDDEPMGIRGIFLIRAVEYSVDLSDGTQTRITCAPPETYNVRIGDEADARKARRGENLQT